MKTFILLAVVALAQSAKLPKFVTKCSRNDPNLQDCVLKSAIESWPSWKMGVKRLHLPSLDPFFIEKVHIDAGSLKLNIYKSNIHGLTDAIFKTVKVDLTNHAIDVVISVPSVSLIGDYDVSGKLLLLPISGAGAANVTFVDGIYNYHLDFNMVQKGEHTYLEPKEATFAYTCRRAYFKLDNLFEGNKILGEEMHKFLDENWEDINKELGPQFVEVLVEIVTSILRGITNKVPYDEFFLD